MSAIPRYILFFDCETTGVTIYGSHYNVDFNKVESSSHLVQLSWKIVDSQEDWKVVSEYDFLIKPDTYECMPVQAEQVHGFSYHLLQEKGVTIIEAVSTFLNSVRMCHALVAHNASFDIKMVQLSAYRCGLFDELYSVLREKTIICTKKNCRTFCDARDKRGRRKDPRLDELYFKIFGKEIEQAHNAVNDVLACLEVFKVLSSQINWIPDRLV